MAESQGIEGKHVADDLESPNQPYDRMARTPGPREPQDPGKAARIVNVGLPALAATVLVLIAMFAMDMTYVLWAGFAALWTMLGWRFTMR